MRHELARRNGVNCRHANRPGNAVRLNTGNYLRQPYRNAHTGVYGEIKNIISNVLRPEISTATNVPEIRLVEILHRCFQLRVIQLASVDKTPARPAAPEIAGNAGIGHAATVASDGMQHIAALVADHLIERRSESSHGNNPKKSPDEP